MTLTQLLDIFHISDLDNGQYSIDRNLYYAGEALFCKDGVPDICSINLMQHTQDVFNLLVPLEVGFIQIADKRVWVFPKKYNQYWPVHIDNYKSCPVFTLYDDCLDYCACFNSKLMYHRKLSILRYISILKELIYEASIRLRYFETIKTNMKGK